MPKRKPDEVIGVRLELQESERAVLEMGVAAWSFNRISDPLIKLINDNTSLVLILSILATYLGFKYIPPKIEEGLDIIADYKEQYDQAVAEGSIIRRGLEQAYDERVDPIVQAARRGPLWGIIDMAEQVLGINLPDFGGGYEPGDQGSGSGGGGGF